jgi:hypothetical protein
MYMMQQEGHYVQGGREGGRRERREGGKEGRREGGKRMKKISYRVYK